MCSGTLHLAPCRLSDNTDSRQQSLPAGGVAELIGSFRNLKDLTLYLHKPAEVNHEAINPAREH